MCPFKNLWKPEKLGISIKAYDTQLLQTVGNVTSSVDMLYRPKLANGNWVPLSWPINLYRYINNICWPLEDDASILARVFDRSCWLLAFLVFVQHNDAEFRYLAKNIQNLDQMLTGMPTYLVLVEMHLRAFQLGLKKKQFRRFLQKFYAEIYIEKSKQPLVYGQIQRQLRPTFAVAFLYVAALSLYLIIPFLNLIYQRKDLLYQMIFPFDYTPTHIYIPIILSNVWVGVIITSMIFGEAMLLANAILHLNGQFLLLRRDLNQRTNVLLKRSDATNIAVDFGREIVEILKRNVKLNKFAAEIQEEFSFRIFAMFSFSAALLCALGFKVYTNPSASVVYILWMCAKTIELLAIGQLGSTLAYMTDEMSTMYYESLWESVIKRSSNVRENVRLMKLIVVAIETNQKPFYLTGWNFFTVSLVAVLKILQGASSYFTCLIAIR